MSRCELSPENLKKAREMYKNMIRFTRIADELGITYHAVRSALDPAFRARRAASSAAARVRLRCEANGEMAPPPSEAVGHEFGRHAADAAYDPLRDGWLPLRDDLTAVMLGDPPVGRSALDRMRSGHP